MENVRNHRDIKLKTSRKRKKRVVSEPNYHSCNKFSDHLIAIEMKKTIVKMNKPLYLGMPILDISKTLMYKFLTEDFFKIFLLMLKNDLTRLAMIKMIKDLFQ